MKKVPNILTTIRILLIPLFVFLYSRSRETAAAIFLLACITDIADGYIARKYGATTVFGTLFDPLADKLLQISAVICMYTEGILALPVMVIVIIKETVMMTGAVILLFKKTVIPSNIAGKGSTVLVSAGIILCVAIGARFGNFIKITEVVIIIAALVSLAVYMTLFAKHIFNIGNKKITNNPED